MLAELWTRIRHQIQKGRTVVFLSLSGDVLMKILSRAASVVGAQSVSKGVKERGTANLY